jgi:putative addiction module component (TIGR02574 family)
MDHFNLSQLSESERLVLARDLLESAVAQEDHSPLSPEQIAELRRRAAAIDSGQAQCIPWEEALATLLKQRGL